jgi:hypothetical protein
MSNSDSNSSSPWGDRGAPKKDPPIGTTTLIHFTFDDLIRAALAEELHKRGWSQHYAVTKVDSVMREIAPGQSSFDGLAVTIERIP